MSDYEKIAKLLVIIGGLVALIESIVGFFQQAIFNAVPIFGNIIVLVLAVLVLYMVFEKKPIDWDNGIIILIFGILFILFGALFGGILLIIAAVLLFLD